MKSSPRAPRRFSRWQTTKRTFVLGGAVSRPPSTTDDQERKRLNLSSVSGKDTVLPDNSSSDDVEKEPKQSSSQEIAKPKHVRKLRLYSGRVAKDKEVDLNMSTVDTGQSSGPDAINNDQEAIRTTRSTQEKRAISDDRWPASAANETSNGFSNQDGSTNVLLQARSSSSSPIALADISCNTAQVVESQVWTRTSQRRRQMPSKDISGKRTRGQAKVEDNEQSPSSPGIDKENKDDESEIESKQKKVKHNRETKPGDTGESVTGVSTHSVNKTGVSNLNKAAIEESSIAKRTSLRDRSRMMSPADMMKMRQYPEKFLGSAKKTTEHSKEMKGRRNKELVNKSTAQRKAASPKSSDIKENVNAANQSTSPKIKRNSYEKTKTSSSLSEQPKSQVGRGRQKSKLPDKITNHFDIPLQQKTILKDSTVDKPHSAKKTNNEIERHKEVCSGETALNDKNSTRTRTSTSVVVEQNDIKQSTLSSRASKKTSYSHSPNENHQAEGKSKKYINSQGVPIASHWELPTHSQSKTGSDKHNDDNNQNQSSQNRTSNSLNETVGRSSLRDRSRLATPESLQEKRQYPISFYSAKTRAEILNSSLSAKSKRKPKSEKRTSTTVPQSGSNKTQSQSKKNQVQLDTVSSMSPKHRTKKQAGQQVRDSFPNESYHNHIPESDEDAPVSITIISKVDQRKPSLASPNLNGVSAKSSEKEIMTKKLARKLVSLPTQPLRKPKPPSHRTNEETTTRSSKMALQNQDLQVSLEVGASSAKTFSKSKGQRQAPAELKSRNGSAVDEILVGRKRTPQKRKLVDQLSQVETVEKSRKILQNENMEVLLWCEEDHKRRQASDVTAHDVIFQAALDVEEDLRDEAEDRLTQKLVKKVFSGFKRNMKSKISQDLSLRVLESDVRERKKRCKELAAEIAEKRTLASSLQREVQSLESSKDRNVQRISHWMRSYSQLVLAIENG